MGQTQCQSLRLLHIGLKCPTVCRVVIPNRLIYRDTNTPCFTSDFEGRNMGQRDPAGLQAGACQGVPTALQRTQPDDALGGPDIHLHRPVCLRHELRLTRPKPGCPKAAGRQ